MFRKFSSCLALFFLMAFATGAAKAAPVVMLQGRVVHVDDGDTIVLLLANKEQMKVRLSSIDAPETSHLGHGEGRVGQPFADVAKRHLAGLAKGRDATATCFEQDQYARSICEIFVGGHSLNRTMVRDGMAWANGAANGKYLRDPDLVQLQALAKAQRLGLWRDAEPVAPWMWRKNCWREKLC